MLPGNFNPYTEKLEIPKSYQALATSKKSLNPAIKNLRKGDYYLRMNSSNREKRNPPNFPNF